MTEKELREAFIQVAYYQIAIEKMLTIQMVDNNRALVPPHWREEATNRARPYLDLLDTMLPKALETVWDNAYQLGAFDTLGSPKHATENPFRQ